MINFLLCLIMNRILFDFRKFCICYRSMMATSKLYKNGYTNLGWLAGGFNRAVEGDFPEVEGPEKLQYATIGGVSYFFLKVLILLQAVGKNE